MGGDAVLSLPSVDQPPSLVKGHADATGEDAVLLVGDHREDGVKDDAPTVQVDGFHAVVLDCHPRKCQRLARRPSLFRVLRLVLPAACKQIFHVLADPVEAPPRERGFPALEHFKEPLGQEFGTL